MPDKPHPLTALQDADKEFALRLVLASGSLKELASQYGVSYPTIRARLDRLIERLEALHRGHNPDPMRELCADLLERGELSSTGAKRILETHKTQQRAAKEKQK